MKKTQNVLFIIVFLVLCTVPLVGWIFGYDNANAEKRTLAEMPKIISEDGINADFTIEFDDYFTDNFAFRSDMITMHAALEDAVFSHSVSDQVIIGKDGWLFFTPTLNDYKKNGVLTDSDIYRLVRTLEIQQEALREKGIDFVFTIAPNKASIYAEYMPDRYAKVSSQSNVEKLYAELNERRFGYVDLHTLLSGNEIQLYHKLDTHWNNTGAMIAYDALMDRVREGAPEFEYHQYDLLDFEARREWHGDLGDMLFPSAGLLDMQNIYKVEKLFTSPRPIRTMEDLTIRTISETGSLNVLMFRDSFANALIPLISNEFASITYSRATPYDYLQADENIDAVIMEIVERNLPDMLEAAPILPVNAVSLKQQIARETIVTTVITAKDDDGIVLISGTAKPEHYSPDINYDIYVRVSTDEGEVVYPAFPLPDQIENADADGVPFCVRIEKSMLPDSDFTLDIILFNQSKYISDFLLSSGQIVTAE